MEFCLHLKYQFGAQFNTVNCTTTYVAPQPKSTSFPQRMTNVQGKCNSCSSPPSPCARARPSRSACSCSCVSRRAAPPRPASVPFGRLSNMRLLCRPQLHISHGPSVRPSETSRSCPPSIAGVRPDFQIVTSFKRTRPLRTLQRRELGIHFKSGCLRIDSPSPNFSILPTPSPRHPRLGRGAGKNKTARERGRRRGKGDAFAAVS